jgi:hypothetical protein
MIRYILLACALPLPFVAACGEKHAMADSDRSNAAETAALVRGSWKCSSSGKDIITGEEVMGAYSISYVSDGSWAANASVTTRVDGKHAKIVLATRGAWKIVDGLLHEKVNYHAATSVTLDGKVLDHGDFNRAVEIAAGKDPSLDPRNITTITTFTELNAERMTGVDDLKFAIDCKRPNT